jgi:fluoroacetyl-CoA thioesterase
MISTYTSYTIVNENNTAESMGSGDMPVFATPAMCALMENAAMNAASIYIKESGMESSANTTVGISLNIDHTKATPIGKNIKAVANLTEAEGRKLTFQVTVYEGDTDEIIIGKGTHTRFIVERERFLGKLK